MKKLLLVTVAAIAACVAWSLQRPVAPPQEVGGTPSVVLDDQEPAGVTPGIEHDGMHYDPERLYEKAYENDPDIRELARLTDLPARCVIEGLKEYEDGIAMSDECTDARRRNRVPPSDFYEVSVVFERYSIDELKQLAGSEPDAAVLLARRLDDPAEFRRYYEQAIRLMEQREIDSRAVRFELHGRL